MASESLVDKDGKPLTKEALEHRAKYRFRCRKVIGLDSIGIWDWDLGSVWFCFFLFLTALGPP